MLKSSLYDIDVFMLAKGTIAVARAVVHHLLIA